MSNVKAELTKKAIRIVGGGQSFKGVSKTLAATTTKTIDTFEHKKVSAACYKILAITKTGHKDIFDLNVLAYANTASYTQYGRILIGGNNDLVSVNVTVDTKKVYINVTSLSTEQIKVIAIPMYIEG